MTTLLLLLLVLIVFYLGTALFLWLGARVAGIARVSFRRALATAVLVGLVLIPIRLTLALVPALGPVPPPARLGVEIAVEALLGWLVVAWCLRGSLAQG